MSALIESFISPPDPLEYIKKKVRNTRVGLIVPQSAFLADQRVFPFIGVLKVAAELEANGNPVDVLDLSGFSDTEKLVGRYLQEQNPDVIGITATTPQLPEAVRILHAIRERDHTKKVILGGTHATLAYTGYQQDQLKNRIARGTDAFEQIQMLFDKIVVGDGEMAIFHAIDSEHTEQVVNANTRTSSLFIQRGGLEKFHWPARHLIDEDSYHYQIDGKNAFSLIAQLGCPFECGFCSGRNTDFLRMTRTRSPKNIADEIEDTVKRSKLRGKSLEGVMFYDDELNVTNGGLENLCHTLIKLQDSIGIEMRFRGFVKAERFTPEQAKLMYAAGFRILLTGVESGSDDILKAIRKKTTRESNKKCLDYARNAGLQVKALMSIGHPGESEKTISESVEWVLNNKPDDVDWTVITPYPGSLYYDEAEYDSELDAWRYIETHTKAELLSRSMDFTTQAIFYKGVPGEYNCEVFTKDLTSQDLVKLRDQAEEVTRSALHLPPIKSVSVRQFEHSMGQKLPSNILKSSKLAF